MARVLIILSHPSFERSRANRHMQEAVGDLAGVERVHLEASYPTEELDLDAEIARLQAAERIVLQFPVQWYSTPPLLKRWQDTVLTRMFYIKHEEGAVIAGRPLMVAATAGNRPEAYSAEGVNLFPMPELLKPLHATANRCGLRWTEPFLTYENTKPSDDKLQADAARYRARIAAFAEA